MAQPRRYWAGQSRLNFQHTNQAEIAGKPDDSRERGNGHCLASANWSLSAISGFPPARERRVNELQGFMTRFP